MITAEVTAEQLARWRALWEAHRAKMSPNRIGGAALEQYFCGKYHPQICEDARFLHVLHESAAAQGSLTPDIAAYTVGGDIFVGVDRSTGWFHVECEEMQKAVPLWDDLFVARGLSTEDLQNYVLTGQYLELSEPEIAGRI